MSVVPSSDVSNGTASFGGPAQTIPFTSRPTTSYTDPRSVVMINGSPYLPIKWSATINGHGATDEATITLPIQSNPDFSIELFRGESGLSSTPTAAETAAANAPIIVQIFAGYPTALTPGSKSTQGMTTRFLGIIDKYSAAFYDNTVTFTCRSLAAPLVDNRITHAPIGMNSVQFAQAMAQSLNLQTAITDFSAYGKTPITIQEMLGREFIGGSNYNTALFNLKPWDILLQCAQFDDADVWVNGNTLNYQIVDKIVRNQINVPYGSLLVKPVGSHSIQGNKNIRVEVRSYKQQTRTSVSSRQTTDLGGGVLLSQTTRTVTSQPVFGTPYTVSKSISPTGDVSYTSSTGSGGKASSGFTGEGSESGLQTYKVYWPGLNQGNASAIAQSLWRRYSELEYMVSFTLAMDTNLFKNFSITSKMNVTGLPYSNLNTSYYPRQYNETYDPEGGGWTLALECCSIRLANGAV